MEPDKSNHPREDDKKEESDGSPIRGSEATCTSAEEDPQAGEKATRESATVYARAWQRVVVRFAFMARC
jgi:hypothetical protein